MVCFTDLVGSCCFQAADRAVCISSDKGGGGIWQTSDDGFGVRSDAGDDGYNVRRSSAHDGSNSRGNVSRQKAGDTKDVGGSCNNSGESESWVQKPSRNRDDVGNNGGRQNRTDRKADGGKKGGKTDGRKKGGKIELSISDTNVLHAGSSKSQNQRVDHD